MSFDELINILPLLALMCAALSALMAGVYALIQYRYSRAQMAQARRLAEESGALKRPELTLQVLRKHALPQSEDHQQWLFIHPGPADRHALFPMEFVVINEGDATADNVELIVKTPRNVYPASLGKLLNIETLPRVPSKEIKRYVDEWGNYTMITYIIPPIDPLSAFSVWEVIPLQDLFGISVPVEAATKDGIHIRATVQTLVTIPIEISLKMRDHPPLEVSISVSAIGANSVKQGVDRYLQIKEQYKVEKSKSLFRLPLIGRLLSDIDRGRKSEWIRTHFCQFEVDRVIDDGETELLLLRKPERYLLQAIVFNSDDLDVESVHDDAVARIVTLLDFDIPMMNPDV